MKNRFGQFNTKGFTLIELRVVMSIITILASMMLPSLGRAKEKGHMTTCINNLHQMGIALKLYADDHDGRFPPTRVYELGSRRPKRCRPALGGNDPGPPWQDYYPSAQVRPLYNYVKPSPVYRCPMDKGQRANACPDPPFKPSNWEAIGCSYQYNAGALTLLSGGGFLHKPADPINGIAEKSESWAPSPTHYILMHEPPARLYGCIHYEAEWHQWHYAHGATDITDPAHARQQFISPVLFVDTHVAVHNFSRALTEDPYHPYEATKDWMWYKPEE
jgi:prepilin-type N-terminal cleavage/methylation domain-containing protein